MAEVAKLKNAASARVVYKFAQSLGSTDEQYIKDGLGVDKIDISEQLGELVALIGYQQGCCWCFGFGALELEVSDGCMRIRAIRTRLIGNVPLVISAVLHAKDTTTFKMQ